MSIRYRNRFSTLASLLILGTCTLFLSGCVKSSSPTFRTDHPLTSGAQLSPEENRRIEDLPVSELLQRGSLSLSNQDFQLATVYFRTVLNKEPTSISGRLGLGQTSLAMGDYRTAQTMIDQVLTEEPDSVPALSARGRIFREQGHLDKAIADFSRALEYAPENIPLMTELGMTFDMIPERVVQAELLYIKVLELTPDSASACNNLGFNYLLQNRAEEAVTFLSRAMALDSKNPRILSNLAAAYLLNGDKAKALQLFRQSVGDAEAHNNIGYLYMTQSRWNEAETAFVKALDLSPRYYVRAGANLERLKELRITAEEKHSVN